MPEEVPPTRQTAAAPVVPGADATVAIPHGATGAAPPFADPDSPNPATVGPYRVLGLLGRGGMGAVFRAEDPQLRREVALKVMLPHVAAHPTARARFLREARAQAKVEHEHVAVIHHVAEHDGLPYLVMPLLKGMTLHAALRANPRPPLAEVVRIGREIAEGLAAAHEQGLIHRDIKPANIWLEGKRLKVRVLDFGLARAADAAEGPGDDGPVTRDGAIVGTPAYMSPEQGRGLPVDARTDLFSLGVVLYQMTTGELPFKGATTLAVLTSLAVDHPPPPHERNPAVHPDLSALVMRLLSKDPAGRPPTAEAAAEELRVVEQALAAGVRVIPLGDAPPIVVGAFGPDPFADLDATDASTPAAAIPARAGSVSDRSSGPRRGFPVWAVAAGVVLAVAALIWFATRPPREKPEPEVVKDDPPPKPTVYTPPKPKGTPPPGDYALRFEGAARVTTKVKLDLAGPLTLEAYFVPEPCKSPAIAILANNLINLRGGGGQKWSVVIWKADGILTAQSKEPGVAGQKVHVAGVFTGRELRLFVSGVLVAVQDVGDDTLSPRSDVLMFAGYGGPIGLIDEVRISKVARYDADFTPEKRFEPDADTIALYHCDEGEGDVLKDSSGNGRHGKITGAVWVLNDAAKKP